MREKKADKKVSSTVIIITSILTALGTIIAAVIGYFGNLAELKFPITSTQTAEYKATQQVMSAASLVPSSTSRMPTETSTEENLDWQSIASIDPWWQSCGPRMLPAYIDSTQDMNLAINQISHLFPEANYGETPSDYEEWPVGPINNNQFDLVSRIENITRENKWIELSNTASVTVQADENTANHVDFAEINACGGGAEIRDFSSGNLEPTYDNYRFSVNFSQYDYFKLEPGEMEMFHFTFFCDKPGVYSVKVELPFRYDGKQGMLLLSDFQTLICPLEYTRWSIWSLLGYIVQKGNYSWTGSNYISIP